MIKSQKIIKITRTGNKNTIDLEVDSKDHNFFCNGICLSNSHSYSYSSLSAISIFLKFKYPLQFFLSLLRMTRHEPDPLREITIIQKELTHFGIKLLPPHLIKSDMNFSIEDGNIRFGLSSIKGVSEKTIVNLNKFRGQYSNKFEIFQAAKQAGLNVGILGAIIKSGCVSGFKQTRSWVTLESQLFNILTDKEKKWAIDLGPKFDYDLMAILKHLNLEQKDEKSKPIIKDTRIATIRKKYQPYKDIYQVNSKSERFSNWFYENMFLGYTYDVTLNEIFKENNPNLEFINVINKKLPKSDVAFVGRVKEVISGTSKVKKVKYIKVIVTDETEDCTVLLFGKSPDSKNNFEDKLETCKALNKRNPKEDDIVIVLGQKQTDAIFADRIVVQNNRIYTRLADLRAKEKEDGEIELTKDKKPDIVKVDY